ncbi:SRPBCC family protein [Streptomyces sp. NPDC051771]|uniref:SRPBCC family protein n=1 Tax=Streptomyces sp. NPDC051771 TaxID=3154847 RepID=UPI0034220724
MGTRQPEVREVKEVPIMRVEESIVINRTPDDVFAFFQKRSNDRRWMGSVVESEWLDAAAPTSVGRRGRMIMNVMGRREFTDEVTEYEPGRKVAHRSVSGRMVINTSCRAEPAGKGCRATVTYEPERLPGGFVGRLLAPLTAPRIHRDFKADLDRLRNILEEEQTGEG